MKTSRHFMIAAFGASLSVLAATAPANAQCGTYSAATPRPSSWLHKASPNSPLVRASLVLDDRDDHGDEHGRMEPIVGLWHVHFYAEGNAGIPDGTEIDAGYQAWHSDGTEILNSGTRPPASGDFCLGVWKKLGDRTYKLNHFTVPFDPSGTQPAGTGSIHETVKVGPNGDRFSGTFTIDSYDLSGNLLPQEHVAGVIKADRLDADSPPSPLL